MEDMAQELEELSATCGTETVDNLAYILEKPTPNFFIGTGKAEEIALLCDELGADTVIFSRDLSGTQQRNLEELIHLERYDMSKFRPGEQIIEFLLELRQRTKPVYDQERINKA